MIIFLYLAVIAFGMYWAARMLLPEMLKPSPPKTISPKDFSKLEPSDFIQSDESVNRIEKLENFLEEKNKNIQLLQKELQVLYAQVRDYDKIKNLLEEEIHRLKEQNRIFRSELGLPTVQVKENSIV